MSGAAHSIEFRTRRAMNWIPLGLTYAFLYMGRYNLTVAKSALGDLMTLSQFGTIFGVGTITYAFSFLINGPLTDRMGGRRAILIAAAGSGLMNMCMGFMTKDFILSGATESPTLLYSVLYSLNMYFQSFGAVAIVKVNSNWFRVTERGTFSAIFGSIISMGILLAFDGSGYVVRSTQGIGPEGIDATWWVFFVPSIILGFFFVIDLFLVRDTPGQAGLQDIETGAAILSEGGKPLPTMDLLKKILTNPIILTVAFVEFCTGVLRNGVMHWSPLYAKTSLVLPSSDFIFGNWGLVLFVAGVTGGVFAGLVSDKVFQSRRAPAAGGLYFGLIIATVAMIFVLGGTKAEVDWVSAPNETAVTIGIESGDVIQSLDGTPVTTRSGFMKSVEVEGTYTLGILRRGEQVEVVLENDGSGANSDVAKLNFRRNLVTLKGEETQGLHWKGSWAAENGFQVGDKITAFNGEEPTNWTEMVALLKIDGGANEVNIERGGEAMTLAPHYPAHAPQGREGVAKFLKGGPVQTLNPVFLGFVVFFMSICVIGSHGLLSGTATMDFGGKQGAATAVGVIDGFVYLGTGLQSFALGYLTEFDWSYWPLFLLPFAILGFVLCTRIWHVKPSGASH